MTGVFQIRKQNDGGVQELREYDSKVVLAVGDPVSFSTDGTIKAYATGDVILGVNDSQMIAPEFYEQADLDAIATTPVTVLVSPIKQDESEVEVVPAVAITDEAAMKGYIGLEYDFNVSNELVMTLAGTDARVSGYKKYTAKDGTATFNPIVTFNTAVFG